MSDWHGILQSPAGPMTLIVTIGEGEKAALRGELASPDQGPGKIPLTTVSATDGHLAFTVRPPQISYEGEWVAAEQHWSGVFTQGGKIPLKACSRQHDDVIEALASDRSDESFDVGVLPWSARRRYDFLHADGIHTIERMISELLTTRVRRRSRGRIARLEMAPDHSGRSSFKTARPIL